ncbi:MAG: NAD(P)H-dependent oxidoreductase [Pseudomonadota bacterium]
MTAVATERSRVLLITGAGHDVRTRRMIRLSQELLEAEGVEVDMLDPDRHQATDVYEKWLFAHAVIVIAPAGEAPVPSHFRQPIDRMAGAGYPAQLANRAYGVVVHGDDARAEESRRALNDWFDAMGMVDSDSFAILDRHLGYHEPAVGDEPARKGDDDYQAEVRNVARAVANAVTELRAGRLSPPERRARSAA